MIDFNQGFDFLSGSKVLVVGDVMLDHNILGECHRVSPEAPVPVVNVNGNTYMLGGAANVAAGVSRMGACCGLLGVVGCDNASQIVRDLLSDFGVTDLVVGINNFDTVRKCRVVANGHQMLRLDYEQMCNDQHNIASFVFDQFIKHFSDYDVIVFSDYAKGALLNVSIMIQHAIAHKKFVIVDPKGDDFSKYSGANIITPNFSEFSSIFKSKVNDSNIIENAIQFCRSYQISSILVTRSEKGMTLVNSNSKVYHLNSEAVEVFDVTGAGDTVVATLAAFIASGYNLKTAVDNANKAAGIAVSRFGTSVISSSDLLLSNRTLINKFLSIDKLSLVLSNLQSSGKKIVMTNGCFDLLHPGHIEYLSKARALGDFLVVALNSDSSIKSLKGNSRPINTLSDRVEMLSAYGFIDYICSFDSDTPLELYEILKPDVLVKGGDYVVSEIVGSELVIDNGGIVEVIDFKEGYSSSNLIRKIKSV